MPWERDLTKSWKESQSFQIFSPFARRKREGGRGGAKRDEIDRKKRTRESSTRRSSKQLLSSSHIESMAWWYATESHACNSLADGGGAAEGWVKRGRVIGRRVDASNSYKTKEKGANISLSSSTEASKR